jgi:hypothetical protein
MLMPKAAIAFARWLAVGNGFYRLSPAERRTAWSAAVWAHVILIPVSLGFIALAPKLHPTLFTVLFVQFLFATLPARLAVFALPIWEACREPGHRSGLSGWCFAFEVTLIPLFLVSFSLWLFS